MSMQMKMQKQASFGKKFAIYPEECTRNEDIGQAFDDIYSGEEEWILGSAESQSGEGSELKNAWPTANYLSQFIKEHGIRSFADIPCGDVNWQFGSKDLNTISVYFGGDISRNVINANKAMFRDHPNKVFQVWDLTKSQIPKFKMMDDEDEYQAFDMALTRDCIQHLSFEDGLQFVKNVVESGIKYWAVTSYPAEENENISAGEWYANNMEIQPFNLPNDSIVFRQKSHEWHEADDLIVYKVDDKMKEAVANY